MKCMVVSINLLLRRKIAFQKEKRTDPVRMIVPVEVETSPGFPIHPNDTSPSKHPRLSWLGWGQVGADLPGIDGAMGAQKCARSRCCWLRGRRVGAHVGWEASSGRDGFGAKRGAVGTTGLAPSFECPLSATYVGGSGPTLR